MGEFAMMLVILVILWVVVFEGAMLYLCYQTHNMICDIREYVARGRGKK